MIFLSISPCYTTTVTDTGAQSCLCSSKDFYRCGLKNSDLLPEDVTMVAENKEEIQISGAIFIPLSGKDNLNTTPIMVYVSPNTNTILLISPGTNAT